MTYHVARNSQTLGIYPKEELIKLYNAGTILPTDLVWTDNMAAWEPASKIFGAPVAPDGGGVDAPATPPPYAPPPLVTGVATPMNASATPPPPAGGNVFTQPMDQKQRPANNMTLSIVSTVLNVLICNILGLVCSIIAIVMSTQVNQKFDRGDLAGAQSSAKTSKILGWVGIGLFVFGLVVSILIVAGSMAQSMRRY